MSNKRDSFVFYRSFYEAMEDLPDSDQLDVYKAITIYALEGIEPDVTGYPKAIFRLIKPIIEANNKRWENGQKGAEHGRKGGRPKKGKETPKKPLDNPTLTPNKDVDKDVLCKMNNVDNLSPKGYENLSFEFLDENFQECFFSWLEYKCQRREKYKTQKSLESCYKQMVNKSGNDPKTAMSMIDQSMANNWAGLFEISDKEYGKNKIQQEKPAQTYVIPD